MQNLLGSARLTTGSGAPAVLGLRRQDAGANIRVSERPEGRAADAASNPHLRTVNSGSCAPATRPILSRIGPSLATVLQRFLKAEESTRQHADSSRRTQAEPGASSKSLSRVWSGCAADLPIASVIMADTMMLTASAIRPM